MPDGPKLRVACIIINYRSADLVCNLLKSFAKNGLSQIHPILVVDNASGDDSLPHVEAWANELGMTERVQVLDAGRNAGFGAGNNVGAAKVQSVSVKPDILWMLNPDTLVDPIDLGPALRWFEEDPSVGIVGTGMIDGDGEQDLAGHREILPITEWIKNAGAFGMLRRWAVSDPSLNRPGPVDWVSGASLLIRTKVFEELGGFDEGFFLYFEEVDLCRRARQAGWKVVYEPRSRIVHLEGKSTGVGNSKSMPRYWYESRRRFFVKHYGLLGLWAADLAWSSGRIAGILRGRGPSSCRWRDLWRCDLPVLLGREKLNVGHVSG
jgi:N-acetylglucosaminyl-diphospho-decaprenol L-rhamnosyltransferase